MHADARRTLLAHVLVDLASIAALTLLALYGLIPGEIAAVAILAVQGAYVLQVSRVRGRSEPPGPTGAILGLLGALGTLARRLLEQS